MYVTSTFWIALVRGVGGRNDTNSLPLLQKWQTYEGGNADWNPLNSTESWPGSSEYNSAGVKNYNTEVDGINATVATLKNGYYPAILANLVSDAPTSAWAADTVIAEVRKWGTTGFADYLQSLAPTPTPNPLPHKGNPVQVIIGPGNAGGYLKYEDGTMIPVSQEATLNSARAVLPTITIAANDSECWSAMIAKSNRVNAAPPPPAA